LPQADRDRIQELRKCIAALSSSEVDATTAVNTLKNAATIARVNIFTPPTKPPTVPAEQTLVTPPKMGVSKDNKVTFHEYAQARKLKSVDKTVGDDEVNTVIFDISSLTILSKESQTEEPADLSGGGDPPEPTLELNIPMDMDQWKNTIEKEMAVIKPAFAFCDSEHNMTDVNVRVAYQVASHHIRNYMLKMSVTTLHKSDDL
jgi:hypothetical protein